MKAKYFVTILTFMVLILAGCNGILDKVDLQSIPYEDLWNTEELATAYLDKLYRDNMPEWNTNIAPFSDEMSGGDEIKRGTLQISGGVGPTEAYFPYSEIYRINLLIANLTGEQGNSNSTLPLETQKRMKAQALFLRAFRYYNMIIRYGGVPYLKAPQDRYNDDLYVFRDKTSDCVKWICDDLDEAANSLPSEWSNSSDFGRITKGAALAIKSRTLIFWASEIANPTNIAQRWTDAYNASLAAKQELEGPGKRGLHSVFGEIWGDTHTIETVMTTRYKYPTRTHDTQARIRPLDFASNAQGGHKPSWDLALAFPMKDGKPAGSSAYASAPFLPDVETGGALVLKHLFWINRDPRFFETIVTNGSYFPLKENTGIIPYPQGRWYTYNGFGRDNNPTCMHSRKFIQYDVLPGSTNVGDMDWIEIRFAEVLLNLAECAAETNRPEEAHAIIKQIRARAGIEPGTDGNYGLAAWSSMGKEEMTDAVIFERQIELAFECKRFWDMRRRKIFQKAPYTDNYFHRRLYITRTTTTPVDNIFINTEFVTADDIEIKLNTEKYFDYFRTQIQNTGQPWIVSDRVANFWGIPVSHFDVNRNFAQTAGWDAAPGQAIFDPLE